MLADKQVELVSVEVTPVVVLTLCAEPTPKPKPRCVEVPSDLSGEHAALLEWYFGDGRVTFGRSTCGGIIDHLKMFSFGSDPCKACGGDRVTGEPGSGFRGGWRYGDLPRQLDDTETNKLLSLLEIERNNPAARDSADAQCASCCGFGVIARTSRRHSREPTTVKPRPESSTGGGYLPTDYALQHYAIACRRLNMLSGRTVGVLESFFGDWGGRWADTKNGRLFALYALTAAGHKLLRMSQKKAQLENAELRPDEVLGVEYELQVTQPNRQRGDLFTAAREQARKLIDKASRDWNSSEPLRERERRQAKEAKRKTARDARIRELIAGGEA
jgi:hypothetical protein